MLGEASDWQRALAPGDARYVPATVRPQMPDIVGRALAAGAEPPLTYMGTGMTGVVVCVGAVAYKVARATQPIDHQIFEEEADWLAAAARVPAVAAHVARLHDFDPTNIVIIRDCPYADPEQSAWRYGENKLHDLHQRIEQAMIPHGWTAPEFKPDSYVLTTRGPILVDASMPSRVGHELVQYIEALVAGDRPLWTTRPSDLAFHVRMEANRTISQAESDRLEVLIHERWPDNGEVTEPSRRVAHEQLDLVPIAEASAAYAGVVYAARMFDVWQPAYVGATRRTDYFERRGNEWVAIAYTSIPKPAYRHLRAELHRSLERHKGRFAPAPVNTRQRRQRQRARR